LPAIYQEPDSFRPEEPTFLLRYLSAFDSVLAPVFCTLDNIDAYLDPNLAPEDFVEWLAQWVGLVLDENWTLEKRRALVTGAVDLYRRRGTASGLAEQIRLFAGTNPDIVENGATAWSTVAESPMPGKPDPRLVIKLAVSDPSTIDRGRLEALVAAAKPAHLIAEVEVIAT